MKRNKKYEKRLQTLINEYIFLKKIFLWEVILSALWITRD